MHAEDHEHAMDVQWRHADIIHKTDLYDSVQDDRSEARYADDPQAEPDTSRDATLPLGDAETAAAGLVYRG
jgi:hypothetical protein